jgi:hypothetical protein
MFLKYILRKCSSIICVIIIAAPFVLAFSRMFAVRRLDFCHFSLCLFPSLAIPSLAFSFTVLEGQCIGCNFSVVKSLVQAYYVCLRLYPSLILVGSMFDKARICRVT